jgi:hypothetical protein
LADEDSTKRTVGHSIVPHVLEDWDVDCIFYWSKFLDLINGDILQSWHQKLPRQNPHATQSRNRLGLSTQISFQFLSVNPLAEQAKTLFGSVF